MRTENLVLTATILIGATACSGSSDTVTGMRVDGQMVTCTKHSDDVSTCAPVVSDPCDATNVLWPPNHKMISFTLADCVPAPGCGGGGGGGSGSGSGSGDGSGSGGGSGSGSGSGSGVILRTTTNAIGIAGATSAQITSITADEAVEVGAGGDGHTTKFDIHITDAVSFELRSERQGGGDGRVYRVNYVNEAGENASCEFDVPHDQGPTKGSVDSGVVVTVTP
jgi:hypothetical protein